VKDDILLNKAAIIERCLKRVKEEYVGSESELEKNITKQDAILLNLQRACNGAIDMGGRVVRLEKLGLPQGSRDVFDMLAKANIITDDLSIRLQKMVGFRNLAIHEYQKLNLDIVKSIIEINLQDFYEFIEIIIKR